MKIWATTTSHLCTVLVSCNNVIISIIDKTLVHFESKIVSSDDEKFGRETNPIGIGSDHKTIGKILIAFY